MAESRDRSRAPKRLLDYHRKNVGAAVERRDFVILGIYLHRDLALSEIAVAAGISRARTAWIVFGPRRRQMRRTLGR